MAFEVFVHVCASVERNKSELAPYGLPSVPQITLIKASHLNLLTKGGFESFHKREDPNRRAREVMRLQVCCTF